MIEWQAVSKSFGTVPAVKELSLTIEPGEFVVLIGASGSGKSTLLRMANRLVDPDQGRVLFKGQDTRALRAEDLRRRMGYAIQSIGLFAHWTVARNIATVPELLGWPAARSAARSASESVNDNSFSVSSMCARSPSRAPTITPATPGCSRM